MPQTSGGARRRHRIITFLPAEAPAVTLPPVWASCDERAVAQPRTPSTIGVVEGGPHEESTANEKMSVEVVSEERSVEAVNEERSVEAVNEERSVKMTDKSVVGGKVAKTKTTEVPETATAEVSEAATAEVPEPTTAKTMTTKAYLRYVSRMRYVDG